MGAKTPPPSAVTGTRWSASSPFPLACGIPLFPPPSYTPAEHWTPMAGVSFYCEGVPLDAPLLSSCTGPCLPSDFANTEAELRRVFDRISATLAGESLQGIPVFQSLCSDLVERWVQRFLGESGAGSPCCRRFSLFPDLRRRIEALTHELLSERMSSSGPSGSRKRKRGFLGMLTHLKGCALDLFHVTPGGGRRGAEWIQMLLRARYILFLNRDRTALEDSTESESDEDSRAHKKQKGMPIQPPRRSLRIAQKLKIREHGLATFRSSIGIGFEFQADVLEWTGPPDVSEEDLDDSRWLGTKVWPVEGDDGKSSEVMVGRGRTESCACTSPGSVACVKSHVSAARLQLRSDLGQAFISWGFDGMGEDASKLWTRKERKKFAPLEGLKSGSRYKTFWQLAESCFPSKSRLRLLSYYFNVFIPRRMSKQSRLPSAKVSSDNDFEDDDDDKKDEKPDDDDKKGKSPKRPHDDDDDKKGKSPKRPHDDDDDDKKGKSPKRSHDSDKKSKSPKRSHDSDKKGKSPKGQSSESKSPKGQSSESKSPKGQSPQRRSAKGQSPKGQSPQRRSAKGQSPKGKSVGSSGSRASPRSPKSRKKT